MHSWCLWRQNRALDLLELKLWMPVNLCVGTGIQTRVLCKSNKWPLLWSHLSSPQSLLLICCQLSEYFVSSCLWG